MGSGCSTVLLSGLLAQHRGVGLDGGCWCQLLVQGSAPLGWLPQGPQSLRDAVTSSSWYRWQSQRDLCLLLQ